MNKTKESKFLIYETTEGKVDIDVILKDETIWLTQKSMAELLDVEQPAIAKHLINIYNEEELLKDSTYSKMELVQNEVKKTTSFRTDLWRSMRRIKENELEELSAQIDNIL